MKIRHKKTVKYSALVLFLVAAVVLARIWYLEEQGNFHPITPGEAYRSAQMDQDELEYYIKKYNIRSILNLTGDNKGESDYDEEIATSRKMGVDHYDIGLSADKVPTPQQVADMLRYFQDAPRPILIHCHGGADRAGLASAIWKVAVDGEPAAVARRQLSLRFGHMPIGPTQVMDTFFDQWILSRKSPKDCAADPESGKTGNVAPCLPAHGAGG